MPNFEQNMNFIRILGSSYDPKLEYQLIFPSSLPTKARSGWKLVLEDAETILGQSLFLIGREK